MKKNNAWKYIFKIAPPILILGASLAIYSNSLQAPFQFDDDIFITSNPAIRSIGSYQSIWKAHPSRFIGLYSFAVNHEIHGFDVFGYHLTNIFIHALNGITVWLLMSLFLSAPVKEREGLSEDKEWIAFLAAILFITHPVQTQAVTYISQRMASLATLFYLSSLYFYMKGRLSWIDGTRLVKPFFLSGLLALLGMYTKEIIITLPITVLLVELFFLKFKGLQGKDLDKSNKTVGWTIKGAFLAVLVFLFFYVPSIYQFGFKHLLFTERASLSHDGDLITFQNNILTQFRVVSRYFRLLLFPEGLTLDYDFPVSKSFFEWQTLSSFMFLSIVFAAAFIIKRWSQLIFFGILWLFVTIAPNIVPRAHLIFEHKVYLMSFGFCCALTVAVFKLSENRKRSIVILLILAGIYSVLTVQRNSVWQDHVRFWSDAVTKAPDKPRVNMNLGISYYKRNQFEDAIKYLSRAIALRENYDEAYNARGTAYGKLGLYEKGLKDLNKAIAIKPSDHNYYFNRANIHFNREDYAAAMNDCNKAVVINPYFDSCYRGRGLTFEKLGDYNMALSQFDTAILLNQQYVEARIDRARVHVLMGNDEKALADLNVALKIDPSSTEALDARGVLFGKKNEMAKALEDFDRCLEIDRSNLQCLVNRGHLYFITKTYMAALVDFNRILEIDPKNAQAYFKRGNVFNHQGLVEQALQDFNKAIALNPHYGDAYNNRAAMFYYQKDFERARADIEKAQALGLKVRPELLDALSFSGK